MGPIDTLERRIELQNLIAVHYDGCDRGDLERATGMMLPDVRFTLPPLGQAFASREATMDGLRRVIEKLPRRMRHRPAGYRFSTPEPGTLRAEFTTHIMSCLDGSVHAIGDIVVDAVVRDGALRIIRWRVDPVYFRGLISGGRLAALPRLLLRVAPFILPADVRALFEAAAGYSQTTGTGPTSMSSVLPSSSCPSTTTDSVTPTSTV